MSSNMSFSISEEKNCSSDDEFSKIQQKIFDKIENQRPKKHNNNIIKIIDLPFGLWQCRSCGVVNNIKRWPTCQNCKNFF